jgi:hypothetical protein
MACVEDGVALDAAEALLVPVLALRSAALGIENLKNQFPKIITATSLEKTPS